MTKKAPALPYPEENSAVPVLECCKSFPKHIKLPIAPSAHFVPRKSLVLVAGVIEFFRGKASVLFDLGLSTHSLNFTRFKVVSSNRG